MANFLICILGKGGRAVVVLCSDDFAWDLCPSRCSWWLQFNPVIAVLIPVWWGGLGGIVSPGISSRVHLL